MSSNQVRRSGFDLESEVDRPKLSSSTKATNLLLAGFMILATVAWDTIGLNILAVFTEVDSIGSVISRMLPPRIDSLERILELTFETAAMAIVGTFVGGCFAVPLAFMAARNGGSPKFLQVSSRLVISFTRSIPELVVALLAVVLIGVGQLAGTIALAMASTGMIARLLTNAIENLSDEPDIALRAVGVSSFSRAIATRIPAIWPNLVSLLLYRLDINLRASTMLGIVGAGGIGLLLRSTLGVLDYQGAMGVIGVIVCFVLAGEVIAAIVRGRILRPEEDREYKEADVTRIRGPVTKNRLKNWAAVLAALATTLVSFVYLAQYLANSGVTLRQAPEIILALLRPDFLSNGNQILAGVLETWAIALVATLLGSLLGATVGLYAAKGITGSIVGYVLARGFMVAKRALPIVVIGLLFVVALGLGPKAGALALAIGSGGIAAKLISDSLEELDLRPQLALIATGATKSQVVFGAVLPLFLPTLISHLIYTLDLNLRYSAVLGVIGAGGIGYLLASFLKQFDFQSASALILCVFGSIVALEWVSGWARKKIS